MTTRRIEHASSTGRGRGRARALCLGILMVSLGLAPSAADEHLTLVVTSGLSGRLADDEGRTLAAVAAAVEGAARDARRAGREVVVLDAGRALGPWADSRSDGGAAVVEVLRAGGASIFAPSPLDLAVGADRLREIARDDLQVMLPRRIAREPDDPLRHGTTVSLGDGRITVGFDLRWDPAFDGAARNVGLTVTDGDGTTPTEALAVSIVRAHGQGEDLTSRELTWALLAHDEADLVIDPDLGHDLTVRREGSRGPVHLVGLRERPWRVTRIDAELVRDPGSGRWRIEALDVTPIALDQGSDPELDARVTAALEAFRRGLGAPLPAAAPNTPEALRRFVLDAMREATRAEIALLPVGSLRPVAAHHFASGRLTREAVWRTLSLEQRLAVVELSGDELEALAHESARRWTASGPGMDALLAAGLTFEVAEPGPDVRVEALRVNGRPVVGSDRYRVVTNTFLLAGGDRYPTLAELPTDRRPEAPGPALAEDVVLPRLEEAERPFVDLARRSSWRFGIDRAALSFDGVSTDRDPAYEASSDSRARAEDTRTTVGDLALSADLDRSAWRWENRLTARFGLVETDDETRETDDDLRFDTSWVFATTDLLGGHPFVGLLLDSEIRPNTTDGATADRQLEETLWAGLTWSLPRWPRLRLGLVARRYDSVDRDDQTGLTGEALFHLDPAGRRPGFEGRLLAEHLEAGDSELERVDLDLRLLVPVWGELALAPAANFYLLSDSRFPGTARSTRLSLGLSYHWTGRSQRW